MKKVINGKLYDTDTAKVVKSEQNTEIIEGQFCYCYQVLYRNSNGEYFLHAKGGGLCPFGNQYIEE